jgi:hypothetical protein
MSGNIGDLFIIIYPLYYNIMHIVVINTYAIIIIIIINNIPAELVNIK